MPRDGLMTAGATGALPEAAAQPLAARLDRVGVRRRGRAILSQVSATLPGRGITAVIGPNGAGKSTLLKLLNGLIAPDEGTLGWGADRLPPEAVRQAMLLQQPVLLRRTVTANLAFAAKRAGLARADRPAVIGHWLEKAGLTALADSPARRLSGGEQRRLALARALVIAPQVLLLDEPGAGLDPSAMRALESLIAEAASAGIKVVMSTHDLGQVRRLADDLVFLNAGRLDAAGATAALMEEPPTATFDAFMKGDLLW